MFKRFIQEEDGATAIEYGLIAAFLGVSMIAAFSALGNEYIGMYGSIEAAAVAANGP